MKIKTFNLETQEKELNALLEKEKDFVVNVHFLEDKAVVELKEPFDILEYIRKQKEEAEEAKLRKQYELEVGNSYTHIKPEIIDPVIEKHREEIKTLEAKIKTSNLWLKRMKSSKK